ncbi:hypothetical protein [Methanocella arvoryzae]|uniref:Uncharacterized protein n=1 Tax=Methanocella arvoryzae (strain DSM 22066 / NBRC 105507 / MRE50) TaxID=351160 RepID=Q0W4L1_METAR|nr:hypothetical protein [Methanocella arvoryzae]CAJ36682.1 hypothetical protein RCIA103 [Methanocella arvoryzae MRE50]
MAKNWIMTLVLAAAVLAVVTSGTASAYSFSNVEWTKLYSSGVSYYTEATGTPTVSGGGSLTWQNTLENDIPNSYYYPMASWYSDNLQNQGYVQKADGISYHYAWGPDATATAMSSSGGHTLTVKHEYSLTKGTPGTYDSKDKSYTVS